MALSSKLLYLCGEMFALEWVKIMVGIALLQNLLLFYVHESPCDFIDFYFGQFYFSLLNALIFVKWIITVE